MIIYQYSRKFQRVIMYLLDSSPHVTWLKIVQHLWIEYCLSTMTQLSSYLPLPSRLRHHYNTAFIAYTKSLIYFFTDELLNPKIAANTSVNFHSCICLLLPCDSSPFGSPDCLCVERANKVAFVPTWSKSIFLLLAGQVMKHSISRGK